MKRIPTVQQNISSFAQVSVLLRGEQGTLRDWIGRIEARKIFLCVAVIVVGAGLYGAAMGSWRDPMQSLFVAIKFPLIILLTGFGNALLNGMLAPLLGLNISFRESFAAILTSFMVAGAILGSFSPLVAFLVWNSPPIINAQQTGEYSLIQLIHVFVIAFAGVTSNLRLGQLLRGLGGSAWVARRVLLAWLAGNLFLGSQLSWILRPFIGSPDLPVEFLRATAFQGNFYETVFRAAKQLLSFD